MIISSNEFIYKFRQIPLKYISILILLLVASSVNAKDYRIDKYTIVDGLANSSITTIFQDSRCYLWIGTENGLSKYNGYQFENYSTIDGLNNNFIKCIYQSSDNLIWIGSNSGLNVFDPSKRMPYSFENVLEGVIVTSIIEFENKIFFSSNRGLHYFQNDSIVTIDLARIRTLYAGEGEILIGSQSGLYSFKTGSETLGKIELKGSDEGLFIRAINKYENDILIGTDRGLYEWNKVADSIILLDEQLRNSRISDLIVNEGEGLLISSDNGLFLLNINLDLSKILDQAVIKTYIDHESNIWMATAEGLYKYTRYHFDYYMPGNDSPSAISAILSRKNGEIWYGTENGKIWIRKNNGEYEMPKKLNGISNDKTIQCFFEDSKGNIWISTLLRGIFIWDGSDIQEFKDPKGLFRFFTFDIEEDNEGKYWFGGARGLMSYSEDEFEYYTVKDIAQAPFVYDLEVDSKGILWVCMNSGLGIIEEKNIFKLSEFSGISCSQIDSDNKNNYFLSTDERGIYSFKYLNGSVSDLVNINSSNGLSNNNTKSVLYHEGVVWAGTEYGINRILDINEIESIKFSDEMLKSRCFQKSISQKGNKIMIGTYSGVLELPLKAEGRKKKEIPTYLKSIEVLNDNFDQNKLHSKGSRYNIPLDPVLPFDANYLSFNFEAIAYSEMEEIKYKYRLIGLNSDYSESGKERSFTYANLAPGKYTFEVLAGIGNSWNSKPASISFIIKPPFWREWWFIFLSAFAVIALGTALVNYRIQSVRREEKLKSELNQKIAEFRLTALRAQMNPHFIFNALYSIQHFITTNEKEEAINYLSKFASLIRLILENSGSNEISIEEEMKMLDLYLDLEKLRFDNKFEYTIKAEQSIHTEDTAIPYLMIQPFVENAVIHGIGNKKGKGKIAISFESLDDENFVKCIVEDDGVGRENAKNNERPNPIKKKSLGLKMNKERLEILNPETIDNYSVKFIDLKDDEKNPCGTRVEIIIPIA